MAGLFALASSERIEMASSSSLNVGTNSMALMCWAMWTTSAAMTLCGKGNNGGGGIRYQLIPKPDAGNIIRAEVDDNSTKVSVDSTTTGINDGVLRHIAMVVDKVADLLRIYVNGVQEATGSIAGEGTLNSGADFMIGATPNPNDFFSGTIEDVRLYNNVLLTAAEIQTIYASQGHDMIVRGLAGRWTMNEAAPGAIISGAGTVKDISGNGNDGTGVNTPLYAEGTLALKRRYVG